MKKVKLVQAIFTQEEIAAINTKNIKLEEENARLVKNLAEYKNEITDLKEENKKLKEYKSQRTRKIERENKKLKHKNEIQEKALIKLCLKHHYDSIIIEGEEVIDMSNYKVVEKKNPKEEKLF